MQKTFATQADLEAKKVSFTRLSDSAYDDLVATHRGLGEDDSRLVNARLILLLANHIGDAEVLSQALAAARAGAGGAGQRSEETRP